MPSPDCSRELGTFAAIPRKENCSHCQRETLAIGPGRFVEAIYCISLKERPERTERAIAHFHDIGLCTAVTLYQPRRGHHLPTAIWQSHRAVAAEALRQGFRRTLILEDDAFFGEPWDKAQARIERAAAGLPSDWWGLYLGHWPIQGYFIRRDLMRVRSGCAHAYIANEALLQWLADTVPMNPSVPVCSAIGTSIDAALADCPGMYALFPMLATQRFMGDHRIDPGRTETGQRRGLFDRNRYREFAILRGMRAAEAVTALLSPFHRYALERFRVASVARISPLHKERSALAEEIRASGLFDQAYYLETNQDLAERGIHPLYHFLDHGAREGRKPHPLFDPIYYRRVHANLLTSEDNPLLHFLRCGTAERLNPHPLFDTAWYLEQHPDLVPTESNPLVHYLTHGAAAGANPNPLFDSSWYLQTYPDVAQAGMNPLVHYVTRGADEGRAPHPYFDPKWYLRQNPDVAAAGAEPLQHYLLHGRREGRRQRPV